MTLTWVILYTKNVLKSEMHHPVRYYHKLKLWGTLLSLLVYLIKFCSSLYKLICEIFVLYLGTYIYAVSIFNFVTFAKCLRAITNITFVLLSRRAPLTLMRLQKPLWLRPFLTRFKLWLALRSLTDKRSPNQRPMVRDTSPKAECAPGACSQISSSCAQPRRFPQWVDWFNFSWISSSAQNSPGLMRNSGRRSNLLPGCLANPKTQSSPHIQFFFWGCSWCGSARGGWSFWWQSHWSSARWFSCFSRADRRRMRRKRDPKSRPRYRNPALRCKAVSGLLHTEEISSV